jgi:septum formation protein
MSWRLKDMTFIEQLQSKTIVLASGSPRRREILEKLNLNFTVVPSQFPETLSKSDFPHPRDYVIETAKQKGLDVWNALLKKQQDEATTLPHLIISADSIVVAENSIILEKPASHQHAMEMLLMLNNNVHQVYTAVTLICPTQHLEQPFIHTFCEKTDVTFGENALDLLQAYVDSGDGMDKAGGYGYQQGLSSFFASKIDGCFYNVVGFPTFRFLQEVRSLLENNIL